MTGRRRIVRSILIGLLVLGLVFGIYMMFFHPPPA